MVRALVIQHAASDPPGLVGEWLQDRGVSLDVVQPYRGQELPDTVTADALIVLGGEMSAHDDARAPWLVPTRALIGRAVSAGLPTLGICLGAQLLAVETGGTVQLSHPAGPEIGVEIVELAPAARDDPLLAELPPRVPAVQWHFDAVTVLPDGAVPLASSRRYPFQAFRVGPSAWGLQWHPEAGSQITSEWIRAGRATLTALQIDAAELHRALAAAQTRLAATWRPVVTRFAQLTAAAAGRTP